MRHLKQSPRRAHRVRPRSARHRLHEVREAVASFHLAGLGRDGQRAGRGLERRPGAAHAAEQIFNAIETGRDAWVPGPGEEGGPQERTQRPQLLLRCERHAGGLHRIRQHVEPSVDGLIVCMIHRAGVQQSSQTQHPAGALAPFRETRLCALERRDREHGLGLRLRARQPVLEPRLAHPLRLGQRADPLGQRLPAPRRQQLRSVRQDQRGRLLPGLRFDEQLEARLPLAPLLQLHPGAFQPLAQYCMRQQLGRFRAQELLKQSVELVDGLRAGSPVGEQMPAMQRLQELAGVGVSAQRLRQARRRTRDER